MTDSLNELKKAMNMTNTVINNAQNSKKRSSSTKYNLT
jgi:hypothetical protein